MRFQFRGWDKLDGMKHFDFDDLKYGTVNISHGVYDVPVMQFTGLLDSKGNEIYEGDIANGEHAVYVINWDVKMAQYKAKIVTTKSVLTKNCSFPLWQYVEEGGKCRFEVIGNIYENPDLLPQGHRPTE